MMFLVWSLWSAAAQAQGDLSVDYTAKSELRDADGNSCGRGDLRRVKASYTLPLSVRKDSDGAVTAWQMTLRAAYAEMSEERTEVFDAPDRLLNASVNVGHTRPLGKRWSLLASAGLGVYAHPREVAWRSLLANGVALFAYRVSERLSVGLGGGLTNSYGVPMLLPMGYLNWTTDGRLRLTVDLANGMRVKASTMLTERLGLELTAIEMDGMSAVRKTDEGTKIFSSVSMRSLLQATWHFAKRSNAYVGAGGNWLRTEKLTDRSLRGFVDSFGDDDSKRRYRPALVLTAGVRCAF